MVRRRSGHWTGKVCHPTGRFYFAGSGLRVAASVFMAVSIGCSSKHPTYPVSGRVTYPNGTPLPGGTIDFDAVDLKGNLANATGIIEKDGSFRVYTFQENDGAVVGKHRVAILPPPTSEERGGRRISNAVDSRFTEFESSGLTVTVNRDGPNYFELQVEPAQ